MAKAIGLMGAFLLGVGGSGLISVTAKLFPALRPWAFWLMLCGCALFFVAAVLDDYACKWLGISHQAYIALMVSVAVVLVLGGAVQWI